MQYISTGLGTPPHCEISLKADSDETTPPDLILNIVLSGAKDECNKLIISRAAEPSGQLLFLKLLILVSTVIIANSDTSICLLEL